MLFERYATGSRRNLRIAEAIHEPTDYRVAFTPLRGRRHGAVDQEAIYQAGLKGLIMRNYSRRGLAELGVAALGIPESGGVLFHTTQRREEDGSEMLRVGDIPYQAGSRVVHV